MHLLGYCFCAAVCVWRKSSCSWSGWTSSLQTIPFPSLGKNNHYFFKPASTDLRSWCWFRAAELGSRRPCYLELQRLRGREEGWWEYIHTEQGQRSTGGKASIALCYITVFRKTLGSCFAAWNQSLVHGVPWVIIANAQSQVGGALNDQPSPSCSWLLHRDST